MKSRSLYSAESASGWLPWGALAPFLLVVFVAVPTIGASFVLEHFQLADARGEPVGFAGLCAFLVFPFALIALIVLAWIRFVEKRTPATIGLIGVAPTRTFVLGHAIGVAMILVLVLSIWTAGGLEADGIGRALGSPSALLKIGLLLACFAFQSSVEELIFRGWLLSAIARKLDVAFGVVLTSLVFTGLHYSPHQHWLVMSSTFLFSAFACCWALAAGNIWGVMGWHAGWNWMLATGFELPVTGLDAGVPALLVKLIPRGSDPWTGGAQGLEGSFVCSLLFAVGIAHLALRMRRDRAARMTAYESPPSA